MNTKKPIVFFDIEGTGLDTVKDRIITIAVRTRLEDGRWTEPMSMGFNPGIPIPPESTEIHGLTDAMVKDWPLFMDRAPLTLQYFKDADGNPLDLAGYNLRNYDIPILWEEFNRCGINWNLKGVNVVDVCAIFKKKEERNLAAAVKFYCGRELTDAHHAAADVQATIDVLEAQLKRYDDLEEMTLEQLATFSKMDNRIDLAGKLARDKDGDACFMIGEPRGRKVSSDPGFARWMFQKNFSEETKQRLAEVISEVNSGGQRGLL